jgi:hypothetical protein
MGSAPCGAWFADDSHLSMNFLIIVTVGFAFVRGPMLVLTFDGYFRFTFKIESLALMILQVCCSYD